MGIDRRYFGSLLLVTAVAAVPASAHAQSGDGANRVSPAPADRFAAALVPSNGSLRRIVRGLDSPSGGAVSGALRIDVELQVFGLAPAPALVDDSDVGIGAPVYGAPTHDEMLTVVTPAPFRSTAAYRRLRPAVPLERER
jgi:hypothetical protein